MTLTHQDREGEHQVGRNRTPRGELGRVKTRHLNDEQRHSARSRLACSAVGTRARKPRDNRIEPREYPNAQVPFNTGDHLPLLAPGEQLGKGAHRAHPDQPRRTTPLCKVSCRDRTGPYIRVIG